jgi:hypothetical protein
MSRAAAKQLLCRKKTQHARTIGAVGAGAEGVSKSATAANFPGFGGVCGVSPQALAYHAGHRFIFIFKFQAAVQLDLIGQQLVGGSSLGIRKPAQ